MELKVGKKIYIPFEVTRLEDDYATLDNKHITHTFSKISVSNVALPKPKVTQAVMDWYKNKYKESDSVWKVLDYFANEPLNEDSIAYWLYASNDKEQMQLRKERQHALATLIAYGPEAVEVEKENKYTVILIANSQHLTKNFHFESDFPIGEFTKEELENRGFSGVFDSDLFKVEEVG